MERRPFADLVVCRPSTRGRLALPLSVGLHAAILAAVVLGGLLSPEALPAATPLPGPDLALPDVRPPVAVKLVPAPAPAGPSRQGVVAPTGPAPGPAVRVDQLGTGDPMDDSGPAPCLRNCGDGEGAGSGDGPVGAVLPGLPDGAVVEAPRRVRVGEVREPRRIAYVAPVYPDLALRTRAEADVVVACVIDTEGRVTEAQVVAGHPLLDAAALLAVQQWRYLPTLLDGVPVSVELRVTVRFRLRR